jgi:hypothetical protein
MKSYQTLTRKLPMISSERKVSRERSKVRMPEVAADLTMMTYSLNSLEEEVQEVAISNSTSAVAAAASTSSMVVTSSNSNELKTSLRILMLSSSILIRYFSSIAVKKFGLSYFTKLMMKRARN